MDLVKHDIQSTIDALELLKKEIETGTHAGMCSAVDNLRFNQHKLSSVEAYNLEEIIDDNKTSKYYWYENTRNRNCGYYYPKYAIEPRVKWINRRIKEQRRLIKKHT